MVLALNTSPKAVIRGLASRLACQLFNLFVQQQQQQQQQQQLEPSFG
jgi:hypothetical protein